MFNRAQGLEDLRKEWTNTNYKILTSTSDDLKVKVSGNMALITGNWTSTTVPPDDANAEPHKDTGRYTGVYEKRNANGFWLPSIFRSTARPQIDGAASLKSGQEYGRIIKNQDATAIERILATNYLHQRKGQS
jgi:hypothetical protein